jgi:hypothetical protein
MHRVLPAVPSSPQTDDPIVNGWDQISETTVQHWLTVTDELLQFYSSLQSNVQTQLSVLNMCAFCVSLVSTAMSLLRINNDTATYLYLTVATTLLTNLFTGYLTTSGTTTSFKTYTDYRSQVQKFASILAAELSVPPVDRAPAQSFITSNKSTYQTLLVNRPAVNRLLLCCLNKSLSVDGVELVSVLPDTVTSAQLSEAARSANNQS